MDNNTQVNTSTSAPPPRALSPEVAERKAFKGKVEYMGAGLLIYVCIFYGTYIADMFAHFTYYAVKTMGDKAEYDRLIQEYSDSLTERAGGLIAGVIIGVIFLMLFFIKALPVKKIFAPHRKMSPSKLLMLVCILMCCQLVVTFMDEGVEWLLNQVGLSLQQAIETSPAGSQTISMFIYASIIGPIIEEIVYRGFVMHTFERAGCGKFCSIVASAILFGIMHANPTQSVFAVYVGVVFGYAAMEFGLGWSIALHIINNFLFGDFMDIDYAKVAEGYGCKSYSIRTMEELVAAFEDAKKVKNVPVLFDIKVLPKTMTDGYGSWWRVGDTEVSELQSNLDAYADHLAHEKDARKY